MNPKTKILKSVLLVLICTQVLGQETALGRVVYTEGKSWLKKNDQQQLIKVNDQVTIDQLIIVNANSTIEIEWNNGVKTTVEASSTYSIADLHKNSKGIKIEKESFFSSFKKIFQEAGESKRAETSGIRRTKAKVDTLAGAQQLDWIEEAEMSFDEAYSYYENSNYSKAVWALKKYLEQKPTDSMAKYSTIALGHSYLMLNNSVKAKEVLEKYKLLFPADDDLYKKVEELLKSL